MGFLVEIDMLTLFTWKSKRTRIAKIILKKPKLKDSDYLILRLWNWLNDRYQDQQDTLKSRNWPSHIWLIDFWQRIKNNSLEKACPFQQMVLKQLDITGQKKKKFSIYTLLYTKINYKCTIYLKVNSKTIKLVEKYFGRNLFWLGVWQSYDPEVIIHSRKKIGKLGFLEIKLLLFKKHNFKKPKRHNTFGRKYFKTQM